MTWTPEKIGFWLLILVAIMGTTLRYGMGTDDSGQGIGGRRRDATTGLTLVSVSRERVSRAIEVPSWDRYQSLSGRRLFFGQEKTVPVVTSVNVKATPPQVKFVYRGYSTMRRGEVVVLEEAKSGDVFFVGVGDFAGEHQVMEIGPSIVTLQRGDEEVIVPRIQDVQGN